MRIFDRNRLNLGRRISCSLTPPALISRLKNWGLKQLLTSDEKRALAVGRFRQSGEVHLWMYDRFSLAQLMLRSGFINPVVQSATTRLIGHWTSFNLDTMQDGSVYKPESLYMEAVKPRL